MDKILNVGQATKLSQQLNQKGKKIVLVGGCFDILHIGHINFLSEAKKQGNALFVLLESDENIKKIKGPKRPINSQTDRVEILANLSVVDFVVLLPPYKNNNEYDKLIISLKPAIIATTKGDTGKLHKDRQAKLIGAKVVEVVEQISNKSTTKLIEILNEI